MTGVVVERLSKCMIFKTPANSEYIMLIYNIMVNIDLIDFVCT